MSFNVQPVCVSNGSDEDGVLVFNGQQRLMAVLTHLSADNEVPPGHWYLEAGFGPLEGPSRPTFVDLDATQAWISQRPARGR